MKILLFAHDGKLGDAVVNTAFVDGVLRLDPGAELHALASGSAVEFWRLDRRIGKVWLFQNPPLGECLRTSWAIRRERYDFVVTWKERFRSEKTRLLLALAAPAQAIVGAEGRCAGAVHPAVRRCELALRRIFGARAEGLDLRYRLDLEAEPLAAFAPRLSAGGEVILLNLFAADPARSIGAADAAALLRGLSRLAPGAMLVLCCTDATVAAARQAALAGARRCLVLNTGASLRRLVSLCARADLVISPDTSLIHIASALDKPVLGIYQDDGVKALEWGPRCSRSAVVIGPRRDGIQGFAVAEVLHRARELRTAPRLAAPAA